jgi:hypothetical protein
MPSRPACERSVVVCVSASSLAVGRAESSTGTPGGGVGPCAGETEPIALRRGPP